MKKICFVTTVSMTIKAFVLPVVRYFAENTDWDITVVCDEDPTLYKEIPAGVHYVPVPMHRGVSVSGIASILKLYRLFRTEKFDLVQYSTPNAAFYAAIASWLAGIRHRKYHLMGFRYLGFQGWKASLFKQLEKVTCRLSTDIECVSESNLQLGVAQGVFPEKAHVIFFGSSAGVDLNQFDIGQKNAWRKAVRQAFGYEDCHCVFGFAGRITGDKGINELVEAFSRLPGENSRLLLIGNLEEKGLGKSFFEKTARSSGITIHPFVNDIERYFSAMDVLVLPSYREGFGNIIIEAQAMGVPVIVTDIPGPLDAMEPDVTGLVVPAANTEALADAMRKLSIDPQLREHMGAQGRSFVEARFDSQKLMAHFLDDRIYLFTKK